MKLLNIMHIRKIINVAVIGICGLFAACEKDDVGIEPLKPSIENIEIGSGNNGVGMIGRDFHINMDVVAGNQIETIQIKMQQRSDETYPHKWSFEVVWDEYQGGKNTNVHKHFDIPEDAAEGHYDLMIIVSDQNGTTLEVAKEIELIDPSTLPVDPAMNVFTVRQKVGAGDFESFYHMGQGFANPANTSFKNSDKIEGLASIKNVRDDGRMYFLLIKKSLNHKPETVADIDFSKAIVYDALEHKDVEARTNFSNFLLLTEWRERLRPEFTIGAAKDNNLPSSNPIEGEKEWENGTYYFGVVYTNTTHQLSAHYYIEFELEGF